MPNFSGLWTERQQMQASGASTWPAVPGAPTIGTATATSGTAVSVAFTAPSNTGYPAGITSYTATSSPGGLTGTGASSPITVSGLTTGTAYTFTVTATNATGTGPASAASNSVTPPFTYIEDVFSTYLYTGAGTAQTVTNNIDLSTKGGLIWIKNRGTGTTDHQLVDTARGAYMKLASNITNGQASTSPDGISAFNTTGFSIGGNYSLYNTSGSTYASWTFRKQPKFFDVVTYTGDGTSGRQISHSLGSTPGFMIIKRTDTTGYWPCWHTSLSATSYITLNQAGLPSVDSTVFNAAPTSTYFQVGTDAWVNASGGTYVAYLFAHNAGGFGLTGTDNVISCGSFSGSGTQTINLGYEPQWVMVKRTDSTGGPWYIADNMRGLPASTSATVNYLKAESSGSEVTYTNDLLINSTGFTTPGFSTQTCIYIAIRRGPMKVPTDATKVFYPSAISNAADTKNTIGFPTDLVIDKIRGSGTEKMRFFDRLRGLRSPGLSNTVPELVPSSTAADTANGSENPVVDNTAFYTPSGLTSAYGNIIFWNFGRAPSFFDEVCYTGTGTNGQTYTHNLGVAPEFMIVKCRSGANNWRAYAAGIGATKTLYPNSNDAGTTDATAWNNTAPTSSVFTVGTAIDTNGAGSTYVAYLFATCAGVSKVGSYTGTGTLTTINCGFAGGARYVLIKRTDSTSNWFIWDTARGMVAGTDPSLALNSTAAESNANSVYTATTGFQLLAAPSADVNTNGGSYIYLAIA